MMQDQQVTTVHVDIEALKKAFIEVAPLYAARPILDRWLDEHGFVYARRYTEWVVMETSIGRDGLNWGEPFPDYATMLTAVLDEIVKRAKEGVPTP